MDVFDKAKRSDIMRKVKSKNNKSTEQNLIHFFNETRLPDGEGTIQLKGIRILFFSKNELPFLWMVAFGTGMIAGTQNLLIIRSIGGENVKETSVATKKLRNCLKSAVGK